MSARHHYLNKRTRAKQSLKLAQNKQASSIAAQKQRTQELVERMKRERPAEYAALIKKRGKGKAKSKPLGIDQGGNAPYMPPGIAADRANRAGRSVYGRGRHAGWKLH